MTIEELLAELGRQAEDGPEAGQVMDELRARRRRHRNRGSLLIAAAVAAILTATFWLAQSSDPKPAQVPAVVTPPSVLDLQCAGNIDTLSSPPANYAVVAGVAGINAGAQTPSANSEIGGLPFFSKSGLLVKAGQPFTILVAGDSARRAQIGWSNTAMVPADLLRVPGCPRVRDGVNPIPDGDQWLVYPGGIWVAEPMCVELSVVTAAETEEVRVPVGVPC